MSRNAVVGFGLACIQVGYRAKAGQFTAWDAAYLCSMALRHCHDDEAIREMCLDFADAAQNYPTNAGRELLDRYQAWLKVQPHAVQRDLRDQGDPGYAYAWQARADFQ
ncbi:MAG: hypothetical protein AAF092_05215 [Pseudomonadota bacterium]